MRKLMSILMALGVILGLTLAAAPVAAQAPCVCPTAMSTFDIVDGLGTPAFCAGATSDYDLGFVTPITLPITLIAGADSLSVDFPSDTDLTNVLWTGVFIDTLPLDSAASLTISGQHLEAMIPVALWGLMGLGTGHNITVNGVVNPSVGDTYCLYVDYVESCAPGNCAPVQFACEEYVVAPAVKDIGCHFDFGTAYAGIAEDYIPAFLAGAAATPFNFILRDENGGCSDPCTAPSAFWFEVIACPAGETINFAFTGAAGSPYILTAADVAAGTKFDLMLAWPGWPAAPADLTIGCTIGFSSPGDYKLQFFVQCPMGGCPLCSGPTTVTTCALSASAYQYMDSYKVLLDEKWNLVSLPLFPYDTSIASVLGSMDDISQLVSVWYFGQCEDPAPNAGVWHTEAYTAPTFTPGTMQIQAGKAYWIRNLHAGETGYTGLNAGFWVFGTHSIMPDSIGVDMGYFDVCEGWNMVGFKAPWAGGVVPVTQPDWLVGPPITGYLYNFNTGVMDTVHYGMIYEWNPVPVPGDWTTSLPGTATLNPGLGYWIAFDGDGQIYPDA